MGKILGAYLLPHPPIIIKEIGEGREYNAKNTIEGMEKAAQNIKAKKPDTIIVITPHGPLFTDAISISVEKDLLGDFSKFGNKELKFQYENNLNLVEKIIEKSNEENIIIAEIDKYFAKDYNVSTELDHGVLVPLYFVDKEYKDYKLIHITYGLLSPKDLYRFGKIVKEVVEESNENAVVIGSGDLSHKLSNDGPYSYSTYGSEFDNKIIEILKEANMEKILTFDLSLGEKAGECGLRSLMIMAGTLDNYLLKSQVLSYEGPFGVGYGTAILDIAGRQEVDMLKKIDENKRIHLKEIRNNEDKYVRLARKSLEYYIRKGKYMDIPKDLPQELLQDRKAVFVTIKKDGMLRGCIGSTEPREKNIATEIIKYSVNAGLRDPRFDSVEESELDDLVYSVDVLFPPESINSIHELDVERYGIIVRKGQRSGLLLPNLEGVDTVEEQLRIALNKAGIRENEDYSMERFEVIRHN